MLWGLMINASRHLARQARNYLSDEAIDLKRTIVLRQVAYINALRCQLRRQSPDTEVLRFLSRGEADFALARTNVTNGIIDVPVGASTVRESEAGSTPFNKLRWNKC